MPRPRSFDMETVLTGAMHAFRKHGYEAVSIRDLEAATGLAAGSLYNAFGGKRALFDAASAHYNIAIVRRRIADHAPEGSGLGGLKALFLSVLAEPDGTTDGCLITNSAVEFGDRVLPDFVREGWALLEDAFADRLGGGAARRPQAVALLAFYQGLLVLVRAGFDPIALEGAINAHFDRLEKSYECQ